MGPESILCGRWVEACAVKGRGVGAEIFDSRRFGSFIGPVEMDDD